MKNAQVQSFIDKVREDLAVPQYPVDGFTIHLDLPTHFDPYTWNASEKAGHPFRKGMPEVEGFFYLSDEYEAYLNVLKETKTEHPANTEKLPWIPDTIKESLAVI